MEGERFNRDGEKFNREGERFNSLVPELDVRDFARSLHFYTKVLGFTTQYQRPNFVLLSYGDAQLMLSEIAPSGWYSVKPEEELGRGINLQIRTADLQQLVLRIKEHHYPVQRDIYESWRESWGEFVGEIEIHVFDPDGYFLRFSQIIGVKPIAR